MTSQSELQIRGSSKMVSDYFEICIHNLLFQRHIYPKEDFKVIRKFGLNLVFSKDDNITEYIRGIIKQLHRWIYGGKIEWLTMLILSKETNLVSEKWTFHVDVVTEAQENANTSPCGRTMPEIQSEIQKIIKQITASVAFLPDFEEQQTFNILVHTLGDVKHSEDWDDATAIKDLTGDKVESVQFNNFQTNEHNISTFVTYKTREQ